MKKGSVAIISFTGKDLASGKVFDTTSAEEAKASGAFDANGIYRPIPIIVGAGDVIKGIDDALLAMNPGEQKVITLQPKDAFGERNPELVALVPLQEFRNRNMNPYPGMVVEVDGRQGRVQSASGGRVRVDFNPELAGRTIEYKLNVEKEIAEKREQLQALFEKYFAFLDAKNVKIELNGASAQITIPGEQVNEGTIGKIAINKILFTKAVLGSLEGFSEINFVEQFGKGKEAKDAEEKADDAKSKTGKGAAKSKKQAL